MSYRRAFLPYLLWLVVILIGTGGLIGAAEMIDSQAENLFKTGRILIDKTHYLEALDLLDEARGVLDKAGPKQSMIYAEILAAMAQAKIKGRLHQGFPAHYVKSALEDIQAANRLRERMTDVLPQKLAEGYYLEGFIQKKFFMRNDSAVKNFVKAVTIDPGAIAAKRELSELLTEEKQK